MSGMETDSNSGSEQLNKNDEGEWDDWTDEEGVNEDATRSLFDDTVHPSVEAAIQYDSKTHGFDITQYRKKVCLAVETDVTDVKHQIWVHMHLHLPLLWSFA
jgi:hypothetical protein